MSSGETNQETQAEAILSQMSGFMTGLREFKDEITGNAAQYTFVEEVMEHVREAFWHLEKIADRSDHGWNTIAAYENNELALDSEDEKKLLRAEKEAEKRATRKKSKAATTSAAPLVTTGDVAPRRHGAVLPARVGPCFGCGELGHLIGRREELGAWGNGVSVF
eukprot:Em0003g1319a